MPSSVRRRSATPRADAGGLPVTSLPGVGEALATLLAKLGIVTSATLSKYRRYAIVINTIIAAIITPTGDPFNLALMAVPLVVFYEFGIIGARLAEKTNKESDLQPEAA